MDAIPNWTSYVQEFRINKSLEFEQNNAEQVKFNSLFTWFCIRAFNNFNFWSDSCFSAKILSNFEVFVKLYYLQRSLSFKVLLQIIRSLLCSFVIDENHAPIVSCPYKLQYAWEYNENITSWKSFVVDSDRFEKHLGSLKLYSDIIFFLKSIPMSSFCCFLDFDHTHNFILIKSCKDCLFYSIIVSFTGPWNLQLIHY